MSVSDRPVEFVLNADFCTSPEEILICRSEGKPQKSGFSLNGLLQIVKLVNYSFLTHLISRVFNCEPVALEAPF